jgi:hypothetical protein
MALALAVKLVPLNQQDLLLLSRKSIPRLSDWEDVAIFN